MYLSIFYLSGFMFNNFITYAEIYHKGQDLPRPLFFAQPAVVWSSHQRHLKLGLLRTKKPYFTRGPMSLSDLLKKNPLALDDSLLRLICHLGW